MPPAHILNQMNPIHTPKPKFLKIHCNIILPVMSSISSLQVLKSKFCNFLTYPMHVTCPAHLMLIDLITLTTLSEEHRLRISHHATFCGLTSLHFSLVQCSPKHPVLKDPQVYSPLIWDTRFDTHTRQQVK
jgi:hypothetical protein